MNTLQYKKRTTLANIEDFVVNKSDNIFIPASQIDMPSDSDI